MYHRVSCWIITIGAIIIPSLKGQSQIFVEEGFLRGLDVSVVAQEWGAGISAYDFNRDGHDDLTLGNDGEVLFFLNNGDGTFEQIFLNIATPSGSVKGILWGDINNDENSDLLISGYFGDVKLNKNLGNLIFEDITADSGISTSVAPNYGVNMCDLNRDGFLDIHLSRYTGQSTISEDPSVESHLWSRTYLNNGNDTFTDITQGSGIVIPPRPVFQSVFFDFNNDLWPDNHTIVDRVPGNKLFRNDEGMFNDITEQYGMSHPDNEFMSNSVADFDNDGYLDIFMTNAGNHPSYLLKNFDGTSFERVGGAFGLEIYEFGWGAQWIDANNDGWQDLFFATRISEENHFYLRDEGVFTEENQEIEVEQNVPCFSVAKGDFDNNGSYDLCVQSRFPNKSQLLMNQLSENSYIKISLKGTVSNYDAVGSWVRVYTSDNTYVHFTTSGENYISQNSQHLIFGLANLTNEVDSLIIQYPSGHRDIYYNLAVDSNYTMIEGETYMASIEAESTSLCEGEELVLDAGEHNNYLWNTGETTRFITVSTGGLYELTVSNEYEIQATAEIEIEFLAPPVIDAIINRNPCFGDSFASVNLINLSETGVTSVDWVSGLSGISIDSLSSGSYEYIFVDSIGCTTEGSVEIIDPDHLAIIENTTDATAPGATDGEIEMMIFGGTPPYYITLNTDTVELTITDLAPGEYIIAITDSNGCTESVEVSIGTILTALNHLAEPDKMVIYPSPAGDWIYLNLKDERIVVNIYDYLGALVKSYNSQHSPFNISDLKSGLYVIQINSEDFGVLNSKFIKN